MEILNSVIAHPQAFLLVVARISGVLLVAPILSSTIIPVLIRVAIVLILASAMYPIHGLPTTESPIEPMVLILAAITEVFIGFVIGFAANLVFSVFQAAGTIIGNQMGFGIVQLFDPVRQQRSSLMDEFYATFATLVFLLLNGHHMLVLAIDRTYQVVPSGAIVHPELVALPLGRLMSEFLAAAFQMALPILAALLLTDLATALASRAVPQINVFFLGLPLKVLIGLLALSLALPATLAFMRDQIDASTRTVLTVVGNL